MEESASWARRPGRPSRRSTHPAQIMQCRCRARPRVRAGISTPATDGRPRRIQKTRGPVPFLAPHLGTHVFWVIALAPAASIVALLAIRWDPMKADVDAEDFAAHATLARRLTTTEGSVLKR